MKLWVYKHKSLFISATIIVLFCVAFLLSGINNSCLQIIGYDEGYNATVAANFARHGKYSVSYPSDITFYHMITTGITMLLPASLLYSLFGINYATTNIVPLIYGILNIILSFLLFSDAYLEKRRKYLIAGFCTIGLILSDAYFYYYSTHLIGEGAFLFFMLLCFVLIIKYYKNKHTLYIVFSGCSLAIAFLSKSSAIFMVVSLFGIMCIETFLTKTLQKKRILYFFSGFLMGFLLVDVFKYVELGGYQPYIDWWRLEWQNMLSQSSGIDLTYSIGEKINYLKEGVFYKNIPTCLILTLLPVLLFVAHIIYYLKNKKYLFSLEKLVIIISGVCGSSLIIYFLLLGGSGLVYGRRLSVNAYFIELHGIYWGIIFIIAICKYFESLFYSKSSIRTSYKNMWLLTISGLITIFMLTILFPLTVMRTGLSRFRFKKIPDYDQQLSEEFLAEVAKLDDATIYCYGWWQEPLVTLYLDKKMIDLTTVDIRDIPVENSYLIVGRNFRNCSIKDIEDSMGLELTEIDHIHVDYNQLTSTYGSTELFSIYKIIIE